VALTVQEQPRCAGVGFLREVGAPCTSRGPGPSSRFFKGPGPSIPIPKQQQPNGSPGKKPPLAARGLSAEHRRALRLFASSRPRPWLQPAVAGRARQLRRRAA
jgi:hypothetical protein